MLVGSAGLSTLVLAEISADQPKDGPVSYSRQVKSLLHEHCADCHSPDDKGGGLDTTSIAELLKGGRKAGPSIVAGKPDESPLVLHLTGARQPRMPRGAPPLADEEIALLKRWISEGAKDDAASATPAAPLTAREKAWAEHWAYQKPTRPNPPKVRAKSWMRNPIDRIVLARLEKEGLSPAPEADRVTLLRRLSFDLTGLPPTPAEADAFLADKSPYAYAKVVERLLASPRYGERMAVYWLDVVLEK